MRLETQIGNRKKRENGQTDGRRDSLAVAPSEQGQVRQLFNADHRVVDGRLKTLRDHVGKNHRDQDGQNVADLTRQLHHDHSGRHGVSDSCRQRCRSCSNREREFMMLILLTTAQKTLLDFGQWKSCASCFSPTTAYAPGTMGYMCPSVLIPSGNRVAIPSPTRRPNAAPKTHIHHDSSY